MEGYDAVEVDRHVLVVINPSGQGFYLSGREVGQVEAVAQTYDGACPRRVDDASRRVAAAETAASVLPACVDVFRFCPGGIGGYARCRLVLPRLK